MYRHPVGQWLIRACCNLITWFLLTHYEKQFDDNDKVSLCFRFYQCCRCPPVLHQVVDGQQKEDDVGRLQQDQDAVEVHELRRGEEGGPVTPGLVVTCPLLSPGFAQETLSDPHIRSSDVAGSKLFNQSNNDAENKWHTLEVKIKDQDLIDHVEIRQ